MTELEITEDIIFNTILEIEDYLTDLKEFKIKEILLKDEITEKASAIKDLEEEIKIIKKTINNLKEK